MLQALADGTRHLPDMFQLATQSLQALRDRHAHVFEPLPVEEQDDIDGEEVEDACDGRAGGRRGRDDGRGGRARGRGGRGGG